MYYSKFQQDKIVLSVILCGFIIRSVASFVIPPGFDESYYAVYAQNLALGFFDHPPLVAISAGFGPWLTGMVNFLTLRLGAILLFSISAFLLYQSVLELFNKHAARIAVILLHSIPYFLVGMGAFVIPDNFLGLFWLLFLYSLIMLNKTNDSRWFLLSGVALGFGLLSKYHAIFLGLGLLVNMSLVKSWRRYWQDKYFYFGTLISILIFLPNIIWNAQHDWISYFFQFGKGASGFHIDLDHLFQGIAIQAGYLLPWHFIVLIAVVFVILKRREKQSYFLLPFVLLPIIIFTLIGATRQILPHWPMPGYLGAIILASGWLSNWTLITLKRYLWSTGSVTAILIVFVSFQASFGIMQIEEDKDPTLNGFGWKELSQYLKKNEYFTSNQPFIVTHKWFLSGELAFALNDQIDVTVFNLDSPQGFAFWNTMDDFTGRDALFITSEYFDFDPEQAYADYFVNIEKLDDFTVSRNPNNSKTFHIYLCRNMVSKYPWPYGNK